MTAALQQISIAGAIFLSLYALVGRHPSAMIVSMIVASFLNYPVYVFAQGYNSSVLPTEIVMLAALVRYFTMVRQGPFGQQPLFFPWMVVLVLYVIFTRLIVLAGEPTGKSVGQLGFYTIRIMAFCVMFLLPGAIQMGRRECNRIIGTFVVCSGIIGLIGILQYAGIVDVAFSSSYLVVGAKSEYEETDIHVYLMGYNRSTVGLLVVHGAYMAIGSMALIRSAFYRLLALASFCCCIITLLGSHSRSSLIGLVGGLPALLLYLRMGQAAIVSVMLGVGGVLLFALVGEQYGLRDRYEAMFSKENIYTTDSSRSRIDAWMSIFQYLLSHPLELVVGAGFYNFAARYAMKLQITKLSHGHNLVVQTVGELGVVGATIFFGWYARIGAYLVGLRNRFAAEPKLRLFYGCLLGSLVGGVCAGVGDDTLYPTPGAWPFLQGFLLTMGTALSYSRSTEELEATPAPLLAAQGRALAV